LAILKVIATNEELDDEKVILDIFGPITDLLCTFENNNVLFGIS